VDGREAGYDLGAVDLLIVNEIESRALAPASIAAKDDASVAGWLAETYPGLDVVLTAGGEGLVHAGAGGIASVPAFPVEPVDETAAGDAFIGYLLAGLLEGMEMADALRLGSAAGALAVTRDGAATSIPDRCAVLEQVG
jgi:ribokinase